MDDTKQKSKTGQLGHVRPKPEVLFLTFVSPLVVLRLVPRVVPSFPTMVLRVVLSVSPGMAMEVGLSGRPSTGMKRLFLFPSADLTRMKVVIVIVLTIIGSSSPPSSSSSSSQPPP